MMHFDNKIKTRKQSYKLKKNEISNEKKKNFEILEILN